jgi:SAM-dependent methyltransferase
MRSELVRRVACSLTSRLGWRAQAFRLQLRRRLYAERLLQLRRQWQQERPPPHILFANSDDDFWYWLVVESNSRPDDFRGILPGFPDAATQVRCTGQSGEFALWEGFAAYRLFRRIAADYGPALAEGQSVLDFGVGWGRIMRFFLRDIAPGGLWGIDVNPELITLCRRNDPWSQFAVIKPSGPTMFLDGTFDLVYSFSVFSHFSEEMHFRWLKELRRVIRPGGLFIATTRPRGFIEQCVLDRLRRPLSSHPDTITGSFRDSRRWLCAYDGGQYCFDPLPGLEGWGDACIPEAYVARHWREYFTILDYVHDLRRCPQNVIVARR